MPDTTPPSDPARTGRNFVTGSTVRHVVVMTLASSAGLSALFFVDTADYCFINPPGEEKVAGAEGALIDMGFGSAVFGLAADFMGCGLTVGIPRKAEPARV